MVWSIQEIEDEYLKNKFERKEQASQYWRASDMGSCFRKRYYSRSGIKPTETMNARIRRVLDTGDIFHWKYQNFLKKVGVLIGKEIEIVNEEFNYIGHFDALVGGIPQIDKELFEYTTKSGEHKVNQKMLDWLNKWKDAIMKEYPTGLPLLLYDFKTQHSGSFQYIEKQGPNEEHVKQLGSYLLFYKEYLIEEGRLMYISKDDSRLLEFPIKLTRKLEDEIKEELLTLSEYWKKQELPPQLPEIEEKFKKRTANWKCKYCPYLTHCRGIDWEQKVNQKITLLSRKK